MLYKYIHFRLSLPHTHKPQTVFQDTGPLPYFEVPKQKPLGSLTLSFPYRLSGGKPAHYHQSGNALDAHCSEHSEMLLMPLPIKAGGFSQHISYTLDLAICCASIQGPNRGW